MPTFIDESGDTGFIADGGKPYFRLAAVWVPSHDEADIFRDKIRTLRRELGLRRNYEFKYTDTSYQPQRRELFFAAALSQEFRFAIGVIDKTIDYWERAESSEQHWACATELTRLRLRPTRCKEDGSGRAYDGVC
jgi:hypothetical protein